MQVTVHESLIKYCETFLNVVNLGNRGKHDGTKEHQLTGLIGEMIVHHYLTGSFPKLDIHSGFDGGVDIEFNQRMIDVKTAKRTGFNKPEYVNDFLKVQQHHKSDTIVFCSWNYVKNIVEIVGFIDKKELIERAVILKQGTKVIKGNGQHFIAKYDSFRIKNKNLYSITKLKNNQNEKT